MLGELKEFWSKYNPYKLHPEDEEYLGASKNKYCLEVSISDFRERYGKDLKSNSTFEAFKGDKINRKKILSSMLVVPFFGDVENAKIYILMGNPGFHTGDYVDENENPDYIELVKENLRLQSRTFIPLHPKAIGTGGYGYWSSNGRIPKIARMLTNLNKGKYLENYEVVKNSICVVESVAYHSCEKPSVELFNLPSSKITKRLVNEFIRRRVGNNDAMCFVWRGASFWNVREHGNVLVREPHKARPANLFDDEASEMARFLDSKN